MSIDSTAAAPAPGPAAAGERGTGGTHHRGILVVVLVAIFVDVLDANIVNVAIPAIQTDLKASYSAIQWSLIGYTLPFALMLITGGRLGDIFGRRRLFLIGMTGFTLASAACGLAVSPGMLISARVVQGAMAAMMVPQVLSIITATIPPARRGGAFVLYGMIAGTANVSGPILGGILLEADLFGLDWRPIFLVNVPVGIAALVMAVKVLPESKSEHSLKLDPLGVALITAALLAVLYPLLQGRELHWPTWGWLLMGVALPLIVLFVLWQRRKQAKDGSPLVPLSLFHRRGYSAGLVVMLTFLTAIIGYFLIFTLFLQQGFGFTALAAGVTSLPWPIGVTMAAIFVSNAGLRPSRHVVTLGALGMVAGLLLLILTLQLAGTGLSGWHLIPAQLVGGLGMGLVMAQATNVSLLKVPPSDSGAASGVFNAVMQTGSVAGVAVIGVIFFGAVSGHAGTGARAAESGLRADLTAASVTGPAQDRLVAGFARCHDRSMDHPDVRRAPAGCDRLVTALPADLRAPAGKALGDAAHEARLHTYDAAMKSSLWWNVGLLGVVALLTFLLPRDGGAHDGPVPDGQEAGASGPDPEGTAAASAVPDAATVKAPEGTATHHTPGDGPEPAQA
ncbi:DHA2 family efflux MFS transporter permease subunit [Streptomyces sp. NPDC003077]|uniref:DHA2 family efflux MFS transporter permease subunit n=1 Tax=Streptomyces sp. NPDC003077 TaxID=3154443 RepID=UPI0033BDF2F0